MDWRYAGGGAGRWLHRVWRVVGVVLVLALAGLPALSVGAAVPTFVNGDSIAFSGQVFDGTPSGGRTPAAGVLVQLYGAALDTPHRGDLLDQALTDLNGRYSLQAPNYYDYLVYNIIEIDPPGATSTGAAPGPGLIWWSDNWLRLEQRLVDELPAGMEGDGILARHYVGNNFYDDIPDPVPPTPTPEPIVIVHQQDVEGYLGTQDTYLDVSNPNSNYGGSNRLYGKTDAYTAMLIRFENLAPALAGENVSITDAHISLFIQYLFFGIIYGREPLDTIGPALEGEPAQKDSQRFVQGGITFQVYRLLRPWSELEATWMEASSGNPWEVPGAAGPDVDRSAVLESELVCYRPPALEPASSPTAGDTADRWVNLDVTNSLNVWRTNPDENYGVVIVARPCGIVKSALASFVSSEDRITWQHPRLVVSYIEK